MLLVLGILPWLAAAQEGEIRVMDQLTGEPLPSMNLFFRSLTDGREQYTITNDYGIAINRCADTCVVRISGVGYRTLQDTLVAGERMTFRLAEDVFHLDQVVVTATRNSRTLKEVPVITQVITARDIAGQGLTTMQEVLQQEIPGVEFRRGGFGADMHMQGLGAKNILILVDGERLAGGSGYNPDYSRLNTADIERVEVVKGAASALYGSQAMGGVINIITKNTRKPWELNAGGRWGQSNERNYPDLSDGDDLYDYKKNLDLQNYNFHLTGGFSREHVNGRTLFVTKSSDAYKLYDTRPVVKDYLNLDTVITETLNPYPTGINGYRDYQVEQRLGFPVNDRLEFTLKGSWYHHDEYDFVPDKVHQQYLDLTWGGRVHYRLNDRVEMTGSFHYDNYRKYDYFEKLSEKAMNYRNIFTDPRLMVFARAGRRQEITAGTEYFGESLFSDKLFGDTAGKKSNATWILFVQDELQAGEHLSFTAGGRLDYHTVFGAHFSPKVSAMYRWRQYTFRLNYARGFRSPSLKELYIDWPVAWFVIRGDEHLRPETNHYFSGSVEWVTPFLNLTATGYYNRLRDKIDGVWREAQTVYQYVNISEATLSGAEVTAALHLGPHWILNGAYSYLRDKRPQGELVSSSSPHTGNVKVNYRLRKKGYRLSVFLTATITGAKNYVMSEYLTYRGAYLEGFYPVHFDAYSLWRLTVTQQFGKRITLTAGVDNLFDYKAAVVNFNTSMSPGRRFFVSFTVPVEEWFGRKNSQNNYSSY